MRPPPPMRQPRRISLLRWFLAGCWLLFSFAVTAMLFIVALRQYGIGAAILDTSIALAAVIGVAWAGLVI